MLNFKPIKIGLEVKKKITIFGFDYFHSSHIFEKVMATTAMLESFKQ
jgi:hypothetical protein